MPTPFLITNPRTGTPIVSRVVSGAASSVGVSLGVVAETLASANLQSFLAAPQRVIRFRGHSTWIVVQKGEILRSTDGGASYTSVYGPDTDLGECSKSGIFLDYPGGVATLALLATPNTGSNTFRLFRSTDGITWTKSAGLNTVGGSADGIFTCTLLWRGSFFARFTAGLITFVTVTWNVGGLTCTTITEPAQSAQGAADLCVADDRLFALFCASGANWQVHELVGGSWTLRTTVLSGTGNPGTGGMGALFVDRASGLLVCLIPTGVAANRAFSVNPTTYAVVDLGATITAAFGAVVSTVQRFRWILDASDLGGGFPNLYIYYRTAGDSDGPYTVFRWNGTGVAPTSIGTGGDRAFAYPWGVQNGGSVFWTSGQRHVERISETPVLGGVRYSFRIYSPNPSVDAVSVRWLLGTATDEYSHAPYGTLANPTAGTLGAGNTQIDGLDAADNGTTLFQVTWLAQTDGFSVGDFVKTVPEIFS